MTITVNTALRNAFDGMKIKNIARHTTGKGGLLGKVVASLNGTAGIRKVPSWNAHLSFKTAQKLNAPSWDFPAKVAKDTRYDRMVNMKGDEE